MRFRISMIVAGISCMWVGLAGAVIAPAAAVPPDRGTFSSHDVFVDSEVCAPEGFSVNVIEDEINAFQVHFDRSGDEAFLAVHVSYRAVISANGRALVERDRWTDTFYPDGSSRSVGLTVHVQGPHGIVQRDAGQLVFGPDGSVVAIHGPHPQFEGQSWCFALVS
jgi:hypothetical protein